MGNVQILTVKSYMDLVFNVREKRERFETTVLFRVCTLALKTETCWLKHSNFNDIQKRFSHSIVLRWYNMRIFECEETTSDGR